MSAPVNRLGTFLASASSEPRVLELFAADGGSSANFLVSAAKTFDRPSAVSSTPTYKSRSNLPGRSSAGSTRSGRFVAPITNSIPDAASSPDDDRPATALAPSSSARS